jgi:hypothetical protein
MASSTKRVAGIQVNHLKLPTHAAALDADLSSNPLSPEGKQDEQAMSDEIRSSNQDQGLSFLN